MEYHITIIYKDSSINDHRITIDTHPSHERGFCIFQPMFVFPAGHV